MKTIRLLFLTSLLFLNLGCAGIINNRIIHIEREETLLRAGFQPLLVTTPWQEQGLMLLPKGKITMIKLHGKEYYLYPDLNHHHVLIGSNRNFMQYNQLVADQLTPLGSTQGELDQEWEESGAWDDLEGWRGVGW
ncbi:MAG: hypothetical protein A3F67_08890 [Verrucomicrobia bacterium RIFCSPHIGHO2_12_FULL_41_10]|nr:MAG: hypothetical protein A3F67_08890 [Verrucomicrobia bacterium RIFCSPHIGHO2_12_FULL_41_10]HLB33405.1 hypothetical protein [Chthoniobacterales bacterium]